MGRPAQVYTCVLKEEASMGGLGRGAGHGSTRLGEEARDELRGEHGVD